MVHIQMGKVYLLLILFLLEIVICKIIFIEFLLPIRKPYFHLNLLNDKLLLFQFFLQIFILL